MQQKYPGKEKIIRASIILMILIISSLIITRESLAEKELVSEKDYSAGSIIRINNTDYTLKVSRVGDTLGLLNEGNYTMLHPGDCSDYRLERICYIEKPKNNTARMAIYDIKPKIEYSMYINESSLLAGEKREIILWVNNTGGSDAEDVYFYQDIPKGISVEEVKGCRMRGNRIYWRGEIEEDSYVKCEYTIYLNKHFTGGIAGEIRYNNLEENITE